MTDLEKAIKALKEAEAENGVIKMSNQFRDWLVRILEKCEVKQC